MATDIQTEANYFDLHGIVLAANETEAAEGDHAAEGEHMEGDHGEAAGHLRQFYFFIFPSST